MSGEIRFDERDAKLLQLIDLDARITLAAIGKNLRISKPAAKRRLERLEEVGVIRRYVAIINLPKLGYNAYRLSFKLSRMDTFEHRAFAKQARNLQETGWVLRAIGSWDVLVTFYARGAMQLYGAYRALLADMSQNIASKRISVIVRLRHYSHDMLVRTKPIGHRKEILVGGPIETTELDEMDMHLLDLLSKEGRASLVTLSGKLGVTPKTVRNRMRRLEKDKIILGYNAVLDTTKIGYEHHKMFVYLDNITIETYKKIRGYVSSMPATMLITQALGESELDFDVKVKNTAEVHAIISDLRNNFKGIIKDIQTLLITDEDVIDYTPRR
ncbi:Lrp/AsnC family transcriptional regulator [Candidatus Woesearchaeota archaeon]|nr:Lrp/AsnC family transcriptional regulator [Candidatus Woesearchaeota archaeon]